ncbi:MAG: pseudouridine synthase [Myxococcota bacterium]
MEIRILFRDPYLVAVSKPAGVLTHRGFGDPTLPMVQRLRRMLRHMVHPVHRLDRPTSGVLVFALDSVSARRLNEQFRGGTVRKRYIALVRGIPPEFGVVDHPVPDRWGGEKQSARTHFVRHFHDSRYAVVEVGPRTGRRHQIRLHLKHMSCPIIGDVNYGDGRHNRLFRQRYDLHRLALHAYALDLRHPRSGQRLHLTAPLPDDLVRGLAAWSSHSLSHLPAETRPRPLSANAASTTCFAPGATSGRFTT